LGESEDSPKVIASRQAIFKHPKVMGLVHELAEWPGYPLKRHNDADHLIHKLAFLADMGLTKGDPGIEKIITRILALESLEGPFQIVMNVHPRYGGRGEDQPVWMLCDAPVVLYSLIKLGLGEHPKVQMAVDYLVSLIRKNGWPCAVSSELGKFRGPGRKDDPCPYANLVMLKIMALIPTYREDYASRVGLETLLELWARRKQARPYLFAMGSHFSRLKAPLIWYDILHVLDVLSQFPVLRDDSRFRDLVSVMDGKADVTGRYKAESVWMAWKDWDFGQKVEPSYWITLVAHRILNRINQGIGERYEKSAV
jgi:hypothetical protein